MNVLNVAPSIGLPVFLAVCKAHKAPLPVEDQTLVYLVCASVKVDPAFLLAVWLHEQGTPLGSSNIGQSTFNPFNMKDYGRVPDVEIRGVRWNRYGNWLEGLLGAVLHLRLFYALRGLYTVEAIINEFAPAADGNKPSSYIKAVLRDMASMQKRNA